MRFFFFGLLRDSDIFELVIERPAADHLAVPGRLNDARLVRVRNETFPMLVEAPGNHVPGVVVEDLSETDLERIQFYESVEYAMSTVEIDLHTGALIDALVFTTTERAREGGEAWRFDDWTLRHKAKDLREARLWMSLYGHLDAQAADRLWDETLAAGRTIEDLVRDVRGASFKLGDST